MSLQTGIEEAIVKAGSMSALARAMEPPVSQQAIQQWRARGWVPEERVAMIARSYDIDKLRLFKPAIVAALID